MSEIKSSEPMLDMYIFETTQLMDQLEQLIMKSEESDGFQNSINEIFRIMHTVKGSSGMMLFNNIAELSHRVEDVFYFLRESKPKNVDYKALSDIVLDSVDFIRNEIGKIENQNPSDGDPSEKIITIGKFLDQVRSGSQAEAQPARLPGKETETPRFFVTNKSLKTNNNRYEAIIRFEDGCEMENIRAYGLIHRLSEIADKIRHIPEDVIENGEAAGIIREKGFRVSFNSSLSIEAVRKILEDTVFLSELKLDEVENNPEEKASPVTLDQYKTEQAAKKDADSGDHENGKQPAHQMISISLEKTDRLMNLIGELVIAESMVTECPDPAGMKSQRFKKAARHLKKITSEIQDVAMSIRMVPLEATFHKMQRIIRDMSRKLDKEISLNIIGEDTEVDKNIIEHISDPLMHCVRNAIDHGLETPGERESRGKPAEGTITLEARNSGNEVLIIVRDDGKGLDRDKILKKALEDGLIEKSGDELSDKEIYNLIFLPGFSTKEKITEYSGRGVGLDVVNKNIQAIGGSVQIDSIPGSGTTITMKIPLTLAIIDSMNIKVGQARYTLPTTGIRESFRPRPGDVFQDPNGNEMIAVRGKVYPILRLHKRYNVANATTEFSKGILIMVEQNGDSYYLFADELKGQQQVVVKALPQYIQKRYKIAGLGGCTLLGDGSISLILDINALYNQMQSKT